jgi:hypothetical protein
MDQLLEDESALDGLAFAYAELEEADRRALAHAVVQDAGDATQALATFLAIEENPRLRHRLAGLLSRHGRICRAAFLDGTEAEGDARLIQSLPGLDPESLRIVWKESKIRDLEIEPPNDIKLDPPRSTIELGGVVEILAPLLWRHIRSGAQLPEGVERFAGFFSVS